MDTKARPPRPPQQPGDEVIVVDPAPLLDNPHLGEDIFEETEEDEETGEVPMEVEVDALVGEDEELEEVEKEVGDEMGGEEKEEEKEVGDEVGEEVDEDAARGAIRSLQQEQARMQQRDPVMHLDLQGVFQACKLGSFNVNNQPRHAKTTIDN